MITQSRLKELMTYDPLIGSFVWNFTKSSRATKGKLAGTIHHQGYSEIKIDGKLYRASRLAWLYMTGSFPDQDIDHKNKIKNDNRWENLRLASDTQNMANRSKPKNNTSGVKGVYFDGKKYITKIKINSRSIHLGRFISIEEAKNAYNTEAIKLFGEYASLNP